MMVCAANVVAQSSSRSCDCDPSCIRNMTALDCTNSRVRGRPDCPCCLVCAGQTNEVCNDGDKPCDEDFGLRCVNGRCEAEQQCQVDNDCPSTKFCLDRVCADPCKLINPCKTALANGICVTKDHRPICRCPEGFVLSGSNVCLKLSCEYEGENYFPTDLLYKDNCTKTCECQLGGDFRCGPTSCPPGTFRSGSFDSDPYCMELKEDTGNPCCTRVACSEGGSEEKSEELDFRETPEFCENVACGPQAECRRNRCFCVDGFVGDPNDLITGCQRAAVSRSNDEDSPSLGLPSAILAPDTELPESFEVKETTHNSTVILLPIPDGGVIEYAPKGFLDDSTRVSTQPVPADALQTILEGLEPDTEYDVRWTVGSESSQLLHFRTKAGCVASDSRSYGVGERFTVGCEKSCVCAAPGQEECENRCLFRRGFLDDPLCSEEDDPSDPDCCVLYICADESREDEVTAETPASLGTDKTTETMPATEIPEEETTESSPETEPTDKPVGDDDDDDDDDNVAVNGEKTESRQDKADSGSDLPTLIVTGKSPGSVTLAWDNFQPPQYTDGYVAEYRVSGELSTGEWKRQVQERGSKVPTITIGSLRPGTTYQVRVSIYEDLEEDMLGASTETIVVTTDAGCYYNNTAYPVGQELLPNCGERCECLSSGTMSCQPRCTIPFFRKGSFDKDPLCSEQSSDVDECCVLVACQSGSAREETVDPCMDITCGRNAECVPRTNSTDPSEGLVALCVCKKGYSGNPTNTDTGCVKESEMSMKEACTFSNKTYMPGNEFFDGCDYKCVCNKEAEIECQARCQYRAQSLPSLSPGCEVIPDPNDDCCKKVICIKSDNSTEKHMEPSIPSDGCVDNGTTYQRNESFTQGCEKECRCMGYGDLSCFPRCPPLPPPVGKDCVTLPDPTDSCCNITICQQEEILSNADVMRSDVTTAGNSNEETTEATTDEPELTTSTVLPSEMEVKTTTVDDREGTDAATTMTIPIDERPKESRLASDGLIKIDAALVNGTTIHLTLSVSDSTLDHFLSSESKPLVVLLTEDLKEWERRVIHVDEVSVRGSQLIVDVSDVEDGDSHFVKVVYLGEESDPIMVKLDPPVPQADVCEYRNASAAVGEEFFVGCEERCQCMVGAEVSCAPRCSSFMQIGGPNDCYPIPDPNDACCTIPFCDPGGRSKTNKSAMSTEATPQDETTEFKTDDAASSTDTLPEPTCQHDGKTYKKGEEFYKGCSSYCICSDDARVICADIECPHMFGLDLVNPMCIEWDTDPDFVAEPPNCCPDIECKNDGSCLYEEEKYENFAQIPQKVTGCEKLCYCEFGNVTCRATCPPVPATPPSNLPCEPYEAKLDHLPDDDCCLYWQCLEDREQPAFPPGFPPAPPSGGLHPQVLPFGPGTPRKEVSNVDVSPVDSTMVRIEFEIPPLYIGLYGHVEILYTDASSSAVDPSQWQRRVFSRPSDLFDEPTLGFTLDGLVPDTEYSIQVQVIIQDTSNVISSKVVTVKTPMPPVTTTTLPPKIPIDAELKVSEIQEDSAKVSWRRFTEFEIGFIDGVQLRFRNLDVDAKVWTMTPLIHRENTWYHLRELQSNTTFEVDIVFMPFQNQTTDLVSMYPIQLKTLPVQDIYAFEIYLEGADISSSAIRLTWTGVPYPQYKYVSVYRMVYIADQDREEHHDFKLPKPNDNPTVTIKQLKPSTRYQVYLEAYLTNGKKKQTNVIEVTTKAGPAATATKPDKPLKVTGGLNGNSESPQPQKSYYNALVAVAILAAIAILIVIVLSYLLLKRQNTAKAAISARKPDGAYDNPSFKTSELEMNGMNGKDSHKREGV